MDILKLKDCIRRIMLDALYAHPEAETILTRTTTDGIEENLLFEIAESMCVAVNRETFGLFAADSPGLMEYAVAILTEAVRRAGLPPDEQAAEYLSFI